MEQSSRNAQDGISMIQTAEGALNEVSDMLVRIKELYTQKANGTYSTTDAANMTSEVTALQSEITNITSNTKFNGVTLLDGSLDVDIQIGDTSTDVLNVALGAITVTSTDLDLTTTAIDNVSTARSTLGALQNRLEHAVNNINNNAQNSSAAESRIRDVDMAKEMMNFSKNNILSQAAQAMLAQANSMPNGVLQLLK
jgi:flagellin